VDKDNYDLLPTATRAICESVDRLTAAIESLHQDWKTDPQRAIGEIMLQNLKAQMGGGILAAGGILKPGH
jgi:hypothetical protein